MRKIRKITPFLEEPSRWYTDVVLNSGLVTYGPTRGSLIFKPLSIEIWERIKLMLDNKFRGLGVKNVYMPLLIPESYIKREKEHVKGFNPELAAINEVGGEKLGERLFIRPTSETIFTDLFRDQLNSYKDLPLLYNQWVNVLRWEKTTTPLLRNTEFLWQEGHTAHEDLDGAKNFALTIAKIYQELLEKELAIPSYLGVKTDRERFSGATLTLTIETMTKGGKALQSATSHILGQNFTKAFNVTFKNRENERCFPYQTSWGLSTRTLGALVMSHGDDHGLILPPRIAPIKVDLISINPKDLRLITEFGNMLKEKLETAGISTSFDDSEKSVGFKAANSEVKGTPLRFEFGLSEIEGEYVTLVRRDTLNKEKISLNTLVDRTKEILDDIQNNLLMRARERFGNRTKFVNSKDEFEREINKGNFVICFFAGDSGLEEMIQEETGASARLILQDSDKFNLPEKGKCPWSNKETTRMIVFARSY